MMAGPYKVDLTGKVSRSVKQAVKQAAVRSVCRHAHEDRQAVGRSSAGSRAPFALACPPPSVCLCPYVLSQPSVTSLYNNCHRWRSSAAWRTRTGTAGPSPRYVDRSQTMHAPLVERSKQASTTWILKSNGPPIPDDPFAFFPSRKALAEAGATIAVGTWPPVLGIFKATLDAGKLEEDLKTSTGDKWEIAKVFFFKKKMDGWMRGPFCVRRSVGQEETVGSPRSSRGVVARSVGRSVGRTTGLSDHAPR